ncbi:MAG: hypothetical protein WC782_07655 [Methylococcaceae bacterium]|jgi:hypothetical protein
MFNYLAQLFLLVMIIVFGFSTFEANSRLINNLGDLSVDVAFQLAQPYLIEQHLQYGEQLVFTYGPWGILLTAYSGSIYHWIVIFFRIAFAVAVFLALRLSAEKAKGLANKIITWSGIVVIMLLWFTGQREGYFLFPALYVAYHHLAADIRVNNNGRRFAVSRPTKLLWLAFCLLSGWVALAKFNLFVVSSAAYLMVLVNDIKHKRGPILPLAYVAAVLLAWLSAGQQLTNLPIWVSRCLDLSNGYADAMALGFLEPYSFGLVAVYYVAVLLIVLSTLTVARTCRWQPEAGLILLFTVFVCAVSVKHGMGGNQIEQSIGVLITVMWFIGQLLQQQLTMNVKAIGSVWGKVDVITLTTGFVCIAIVAVNTNVPIVSVAQAMAGMRDNFSRLVADVRGISTDKWQATLAGTHQFLPRSSLPAGHTIDIYPHQTGLVIGRENLIYTPRPAFLSLNAHTNNLALLNAKHLETKSAPDIILFQVLAKDLSVNNRHPALADGPSWPLLMSLYDLNDVSSGFLVLSKRKDPPQYQHRLLQERRITWDEEVYLPVAQSSLIWAEITIKRSFLGKIIHMLYKSPHVLISSQTADKTEHRYQLVPALAEAGFFLSPLIENTLAFAQIQQREVPVGTIVQQIKLTSPGAFHGFWEQDIILRLYELNLPEVSQPDLPDQARQLMALQGLAGNTGACLFPPHIQSQGNGKQALLTMHAPCQSELVVPPAGIGMTIKYGLQDDAYTESSKTDGVRLEVLAIQPNGKEYNRWSRILDPVKNLADRGEQYFTINWQQGSVGKVYINVSAGNNNDPTYDHFYIQEISFIGIP